MNADTKNAMHVVMIVAGCILAIVGTICGCIYLANGPRFSCQEGKASGKATEYQYVRCSHSLEKLTREGDDWICRCPP
jgi:hypothetical protein